MIRFAAALLALAPALSLAAEPRFALVVGSNDGGPDRAPLWYAERDAERFAQVLFDAAAFPRDAVRVLRSPSLARVRAALDELEERGRSSVDAPVVLLYYSGHADPLGLRLGPDRLPYDELAASLSRAARGVRIVVLDACHAGVLTQQKGAIAAAVEFQIPRTGSADGVAVLASASAGEPAQESSALGGSFFTHHLAAAVRGAADDDGDGRVTLAEAFRYAYRRTVASTTGAGVPPQHPAYAMRISGQDDVVLSDLRHVRSGIALRAGLERRYLVSLAATGETVAEVDAGGRAVRVALAPGRYRIDRTFPEPSRSGEVLVADASVTDVDDAALRGVPPRLARAKGSQMPIRAALQLAVASPVLRNAGPTFAGGVGLRVSRAPFTFLAGATFAQQAVDDEGFRYDVRVASLSLGAALERRTGPIFVLAGLQTAASPVEQRFAIGGSVRTLMWSFGPFAAAVVPLGPRYAVRAGAEASAARLEVDGRIVLRGFAQGSLALERVF